MTKKPQSLRKSRKRSTTDVQSYSHAKPRKVFNTPATTYSDLKQGSGTNKIKTTKRNRRGITHPIREKQKRNCSSVTQRVVNLLIPQRHGKSSHGIKLNSITSVIPAMRVNRSNIYLMTKLRRLTLKINSRVILTRLMKMHKVLMKKMYHNYLCILKKKINGQQLKPRKSNLSSPLVQHSLSTHSIASPGAKIGQLTPGTKMYTRYSQDYCTSERSRMIKNNERAALLRQKSKIEESLKRVGDVLEQIKSESRTFKNMREITASLLSPNEKVTLNIGNKGGAQGTTANKEKSGGSAFAPGFYLPEK